ncbi:zinc-dependent metalloprotease [Streptomyces sp. NPDC002755]
MHITVHHDAGRRFNNLAQRVEAVAAETAPLVEAVTGLVLPDTVVIRTMSPRAWLKAHQRRSAQLLRAEARELHAPRRRKRQAKVQHYLQCNARHRAWRLIGAQVVDFHPGQIELVILPQSMHEAGRLNNPAVLTKVICHELTHVAQHATDNGAMWRLQDSYYPELRGTADRDYAFLVEGHAYWADRQITTKLLGAPVSLKDISPHATHRYKDLAENPHRAETLEYFTKAVDSVEEIVTTHGLDAFNQVWHRPDLVPTRDEASTPIGWIRRFR